MNDSMMKGPSEAIDSPTSIELANQTAVGEKYGTRSDESDMDRMGKLQELRVCCKRPPERFRYTDKRSAAIQVFDYLRFRCTPWQHMGIRIDVWYCSSKTVKIADVAVVVSESHSTMEELPAVSGYSSSSASACSSLRFHWQRWCPCE